MKVRRLTTDIAGSVAYEDLVGGEPFESSGSGNVFIKGQTGRCSVRLRDADYMFRDAACFSGMVLYRIRWVSIAEDGTLVWERVAE